MNTGSDSKEAKEQESPGSTPARGVGLSQRLTVPAPDASFALTDDGSCSL